MGVAYQDCWVKGRVVGAGARECEARYQLIRPVLQPFTRQVTVWDLGANLGYFGCRLAHEFGCVSVMVEASPHLVGVCRENALPTTIALTKRLSNHDLFDLAASEHADVVLALSFIHRVPDWRKMLHATLALGEHIILELPARHETTVKNFEVVEALSDAVEALQPTLLGTSSIPQSPTIRRPLYYVHRPKAHLTSSFCHVDRMRLKDDFTSRPNTITSTFHEKHITFADGESRPFVPGMNLWNWKVMGGSYPKQSTIDAAITRAWAALPRRHGDFRPWNLILQGDTVVPIDFGHRQRLPDQGASALAIALLRHPERAYVRGVA